jgi:hypothetical protein
MKDMAPAGGLFLNVETLHCVYLIPFVYAF